MILKDKWEKYEINFLAYSKYFNSPVEVEKATKYLSQYSQLLSRFSTPTAPNTRLLLLS